MAKTAGKGKATDARLKKPLTEAQRSHIMSKIHGKDTKPEVRLRKALWHKGIRYRKNYRGLPGTPDIALTRQKIAIFVDGDFWHARGHEEHPGEQVKHNRAYWVRHLTRNVEKAREVNDELTEQGWLVLRFWESDINKDLPSIVKQISQYL
ncbi:very short patch repair endonuclease [Mitsuokella sp.]|uniref:very short patch repair endonuclease n=1 Tax=Mitsuokella sp. TaxID=2049034 RepID=UPI002A7F88F9|nr:very short patch repair endonuclease [Mitsuokella sp.]MDY4474360.1 very short patch repair endonuclease [Mitsuokella sp.]